MALGDNAAAVLARGRCAAEALMVDTCTIEDPAEPTFDRDTRTYSDPGATPLYAGRCRVQLSDALNVQGDDVGGALLTVQRITLQLPISATGMKVGAIVTLTSASCDPDLLDRHYRVTGLHAKTHATARRLQCEEITS